MSKQKKESFFWTSFSDLMTSLFFVMLVLFVLTIALLHRKIVEINNIAVESQEQIDKIKEIENATNNIDKNYFEYRENYKKHILKIEAKFDEDQFDKARIKHQNAIIELVNAGESIRDSINSITNKFPKIQYLLIIEGQASKDRASDQHNYELSYKRAYTLKKIWDAEKIDFGKNCEIIISGSGTGGTMREINEKDNQRFLIHLVPKPGIIEASK
jgi:outer membrane protein OmpA-like peptidoglycan-associated protein